ncbi:MAG TPA: PilZ domain-containing protein [Acidimicrobiales bacterium]|nr:PilZ domain-containing protein [Acidimicrobiales bacterium]
MVADRVADRRTHPRRRVALPATVGSDREPPVGCRTIDVSLGGALVESPTLLGGEHVVVVLVLGSDRDARRLIPIEADVVDETLDVEAGCAVTRLAFRRMTRGGRSRLADALDAISPALG